MLVSFGNPHSQSIFRLVLLTILPAALMAQAPTDMKGHWQGMVKYPLDSPDRRTVVNILESEGEAFKGNFYSIDQNAAAFPFTGTVKGTTVKISIPGIGAGYEGKLSVDGKTLTGTIKQGFPIQVQWNLLRVPEAEAWPLPKPPTPPKPMLSGVDPGIDVATIKLTPPPDPNFRFAPTPGATFQARSITVQTLIRTAYGLHPSLIIGAPAWYTTERYDIVVKADQEGQPSDEQSKSLVKKLLKERFQFTAHTAQQELPVYALTVARGGSKITKTPSPNTTPLVINRAVGRLSFNFMSMADFAVQLQSGLVDRPVVDQTGLTGRFDFTLDYTPDNAAPTARPAAELTPGDRVDSPNIFGAVQQQLGLKLDAVKQKVDVLMVDKLEKASEN